MHCVFQKRQVRQDNGRPSSLSVSNEWSKPRQSQPLVDNQRTFKTAAMYNQYVQRHSIAEPTMPNNSAAYGYIYPSQNYITPNNMNHFPHNHHPHHQHYYGGHPPVIGQHGNIYGSYGPSTGRRLLNQSGQRYSVSSMSQFQQGKVTEKS